MDGLARTDLTLTHPLEQTQIIELKTESLFQDAAGTSKFVTAFQNDITKIDTNQIDPGYRQPRGAMVYAIGFTLTDEVNTYALNLSNWYPYQSDIQYRLLVLETQSVPVFYMWYAFIERPPGPSDERGSAKSLELELSNQPITIDKESV